MEIYLDNLIDKKCLELFIAEERDLAEYLQALITTQMDETLAEKLYKNFSWEFIGGAWILSRCYYFQNNF